MRVTMNSPLRRFLFIVLAVWVLLSGMAACIASLQHIAFTTLAVLLPLFCVEAAAYLLLGVEDARTALIERYSSRQLAIGLWVSGVAPYLAFALCTGAGSWQEFAIVAGVSAWISSWFVNVPATT